MDLIDNILRYFQDDKDKHKDVDNPTSPEGTCPVCWGRQQYDGKIRDILYDKQIDVNNHKDSYMIIQDFVKKNIDGITLKTDIISECPSCPK